MIKEIVTDIEKLQTPLEEVDLNCLKETPCISTIIQHLMDTAAHHKHECYGLSANQIGINAKVFVARMPIVVEGERKVAYFPFINAEYLSQTGGIKAGFEMCISLPNTKKHPVKVRRYKEVKISYYSFNRKEQVQIKFKGMDAKIIQHEMDHMRGDLIYVNDYEQQVKRNLKAL